MKVIKNNGRPVLPTIRQALNCEGWDRTFEYDGHTYAIISKGDSQCTRLTTNDGMVPCFNLKSRTIRALPLDEEIRPLRSEVHTAEVAVSVTGWRS